MREVRKEEPTPRVQVETPAPPGPCKDHWKGNGRRQRCLRVSLSCATLTHLAISTWRLATSVMCRCRQYSGRAKCQVPGAKVCGSLRQIRPRHHRSADLHHGSLQL